MSEKLFNLTKQKPDLSFMATRWPSAIVARCEIDRFSGGAVTPRTLANLDAMGVGPENRIRVGRKICYAVGDLIKWMEARSEVLE
jgi:hypothetical protein